MGFTGLPATVTTDWTDWIFRVQFWRAVHEKTFGYSGYGENYDMAVDRVVNGVGVVPPGDPADGEVWLVLNAADDTPTPQPLSGEGNTPPTSPVSNSRYAVLDAPTGEWADHPNEIAQWHNDAWRFERPRPYPYLYQVPSPSEYRVFRNNAWEAAGTYTAPSALLWFGGYMQPGRGGHFATWSESSGVWTFEEPSRTYNTLVTCNGVPWVCYPDYPDYEWQPISSSAVDGSQLSPGMMQRYLQRVITDYVPNNVPNDYAASGPPDPWTLPKFFAAMGQPPEACGDMQLDLADSIPPLGGDGMTVIVLSSATGAFAGHEGDIATYIDGTGWTFTTPAVGTVAWGWCTIGVDGWRAYRRTADGVWEEGGAGWTRKHRRSLKRLDDAGEAGQRAKFIGDRFVEGRADTPVWDPALGDVGLVAHGDHTSHVTAEPPVSPRRDTWYGVQAGATGAWAGRDGDLAEWTGSSWVFETPDHAYYPGRPVQMVFGATVTREDSYGHYELWPTAKAYYRSGGSWLEIDGKYYDHDGTSWTLSVDQDSPADLVTDYGLAQHGDYMGAWIWNELAAAIPLLTRRCLPVDSRDGFRDITEKQAGETDDSSWAAATSTAEAEWASQPAPTLESEVGAPPLVYNQGSHSYSSYHDEHYWGAYLYRRHATMITHDGREAVYSYGHRFPRNTRVDWYVKGQPPINMTFSDLDDPVADGAWTLAHSNTGPTPTAPYGGDYYSQLWQPDKTNTPPNTPWVDPPAVDEFIIEGYTISEAFVIEENAVPGGFEFI